MITIGWPGERRWAGTHTWLNAWDRGDLFVCDSLDAITCAWLTMAMGLAPALEAASIRVPSPDDLEARLRSWQETKVLGKYPRITSVV